jgi:hypothetical protein
VLTINEHKSASYAPRTYHNAAQSNVTVAIAIDFTTAGEKLTKTAAGLKYVHIPLEADPLQAARTLYRKLQASEETILNIAGNGIYTLAAHGWTQEKVNRHIYAILSKVHSYMPIKRILTGGQTGVDLAGAITGVALGIDTIVTMPKGFLQRHEDKKDRQHSKSELLQLIQTAAERCRSVPLETPATLA